MTHPEPPRNPYSGQPAPSAPAVRPAASPRPAPQPGPARNTQQSNVFGILGLSLGIVGLLLFWLFVGGWLFILAGFILSIIGVQRKNEKRGTAWAGLIISGVAALAAIVFLGFVLSVLNNF